MEREPKPLPLTEDQNRRLDNREVTYRGLMQEYGMSKLSQIIGILRDSAGAAEAGAILEGSQDLYMDDAPKLEDMVPVSADDPDKLPEPVRSNLMRAYRLFRLADGTESARAIFIARFCRMTMEEDDWKKSLADVQRESLARYSDAEIAENEAKGRGIAYLYRSEATELVKGAKTMFMEFNPTLGRVLSLAEWD
jgi:hypothetical protein